MPLFGKATFGLDRFWNGCASRVETGLEVSVVGVVDVATQQGYAISAQQTYAQSSLPEFSRMDQYLYHLDCVRPHLLPEVRFLAVDGAFAKESFVSGAMDLKLHVVSKLRRDANLRYLYIGEQKRRGRPRKYDGKVDLTDLSRFTFVATVPPDVDLYTALVWHVSLKREIRVAYLVERRHSTRIRTCLLFSTDVEQDPMQIYQYYKLRFQIEFIFRCGQAVYWTGGLSSPRCPEIRVSFQCQSDCTQSGKVGGTTTAFRFRTVCFLNGKCQASRPQSSSPGAIYLHLRPGAKSN